MSRPPRLAVVGAGISGLALAWAARRAHPGVEVRVFEAADRTGGAIWSRREEGFVMEGGPDSLITDRPWGLELCRDVGLGDEVQPTSSDERRAMVVRDGRLIFIPEGFRLLAPTRFLPFVLSPVISLPGKIRMGLDLLLPRRREEGDETLAQFVCRRLGREALERMAQPLVGGIYGGNPERLSLQATMPRFMEMERKHGSVTLGMLESIRAARKGGASGTAGPRYGLFISLQGGVQTLVDRLASLLPEGTIRTGARARSLRPLEGGGWRLGVGEEEHDFDAVALAMPAWASAALARGFDDELGRSLGAIRYNSSAAVNFIYRRDQIPGKLDAFGFVVPRIENRTLLACTYASVKYAGRAPEGRVILRAFAGGADREADVNQPAEDLVAALERDLVELMGLRGKPEQVWSMVHHRAMPHYELGHLDLVASIEKRAASWPGFYLAGNGFRGVGMPDCIRGARQAAEKAAAYLGALPVLEM